MTAGPGYAHSRPVRVGGGAANQHQLDGYGWVLDAAWLLTRAGHRLYPRPGGPCAASPTKSRNGGANPTPGSGRSAATAPTTCTPSSWPGSPSTEPCASPPPAAPDSQVARWHAEREAVAAEVMSAGFNLELGNYTRSYGSNDLDAAVLVLPLLDLEPRDSPRVRATIEAVRRELSAGGPLLYRYPPGHDGLPGTEGAFLRVPSGWSKPSPAPAASTKRPSCSPTSWNSPTRSASCPRRSTPRTTATSATTQALTHAALIQAALAIRDAHPTEHR